LRLDHNTVVFADRRGDFCSLQTHTEVFAKVGSYTSGLRSGVWCHQELTHAVCHGM